MFSLPHAEHSTQIDEECGHARAPFRFESVYWNRKEPAHMQDGLSAMQP